MPLVDLREKTQIVPPFVLSECVLRMKVILSVPLEWPVLILGAISSVSPFLRDPQIKQLRESEMAPRVGEVIVIAEAVCA